MLLDSGSQRTLLNENVKELLNLKSIRKEKLLIKTFSEKSSFLKEFDIVKIKLKGIRDSIIEAVCTPHSNQQCNKVAYVFPHFRNLKFANNINEQNKKKMAPIIITNSLLTRLSEAEIGNLLLKIQFSAGF